MPADPALPGTAATPQVGDVYRAIPARPSAFAGRVRVTGFAEWHGRPCAVCVIVRVRRGTAGRAAGADVESRIMLSELADAGRWERVG